MKNINLFRIAIPGIMVFTWLTWVACVSASYNNSGEIRNIENFTEVNLAIGGDVFLIQGSKFIVELEGEENDLSNIITEVSQNKLSIKAKNWNSKNTEGVKIYITMPEIEGLSVTGSGNITSNSSINSGELELTVSGSGSINIDDLSVKEMDANITGSGNIKVSSKSQAEELDITITGSGNYNGEDIGFEEVKVTITGSGSAKICAIKELETYITGSGNVSYKGNPVVNANSTGSGKTRKMD